ncbi:hypothetical protein BH11MYX2_BH11MYX2_36770 [soil metagenome]
MNRDLHPTEGARYLLECSADDGARATYRAVIYTPTTAHATTAHVTDDGTSTLETSDAPAELVERLAIMVKLIARDAVRRREDGLGAWPERVLRWRK